MIRKRRIGNPKIFFFETLFMFISSSFAFKCAHHHMRPFLATFIWSLIFCITLRMLNKYSFAFYRTLSVALLSSSFGLRTLCLSLSFAQPFKAQDHLLLFCCNCCLFSLVKVVHLLSRVSRTRPTLPPLAPLPLC